MKTREQVVEHLLTHAYTDNAVAKIMGFLIGVGIKGNDEIFKVQIGSLPFDNFIEWFNGDDDECECECDCILCSIINDIAQKLEGAKTIASEIYYANQLSYLLDAFGLVDDDGDEE